MQLWISKLRLNRIFSCLEFEMQNELGHVTSLFFKWNCKYVISLFERGNMQNSRLFVSCRIRLTCA